MTMTLFALPPTTIGAPLTRDQHVAALMASVDAAVNRMRWHEEDLRLHQRDSLRALLAHAIACSPFHRERLGSLDPTRFELEGLADLPTMTKTDMMARFDDVVTDRRLNRSLVDAHVSAAPLSMEYLLGEFVVMASGGSSGERGLFVYHHSAFTEFTLGLLRSTLVRLRALGVSVARPISGALVAAPATVHGTGAVGALTGGPGGPVHMTRLSAAAPLSDTVAALNTLQPALLVAYPSILLRLAHERTAGRLSIRPLAVSATSESLSREAQTTIETAFGVAISNTFGSSEGLCGVALPGEHGICFASDGCLVELVDEQYRAVEPGTVAAKVLVTNLYNRSQPLIRYELPDRFIALPGPFPDGHLRALVDGRHDAPFRYGQVLVHPLAIRATMVRDAAVIEYQVLQCPDGILARVVATAGLDAGSLRAQLVHAFATAALSSPLVQIEAVESIARDPVTGKPRRFIPLEGTLVHN